MALARATAAIDATAHYIDDVTITCPLGLGAGLAMSSACRGRRCGGRAGGEHHVDGDPRWTTETAVIRRHVAIAPEAFVEPDLPTVADDTARPRTRRVHPATS
jgi:hypothetical protein